MAAPIASPAISPSRSLIRIRLTAAFMAGILAIGVIASLYALAAIPQVESILSIRFVLGANGFLVPGTLGLVLVWATGPVAAALSGSLLAVRCANRERWVGVLMGTATYFIALLLGAIVFELTPAIQGNTARIDAIGSIVSAPLDAAIASVVLVPLLVCCIGAGAVWGWTVRRLNPPPPDDPSPDALHSMFGVVVMALVATLTFGWLVIWLLVRSLPQIDGID
jgi:hypothetical protein